MRRYLPVTAALALIASGAAGAAPRVTVESGVLEGLTVRTGGATLSEFRGVPFAVPPLGRLRWRPPQPVARWHGVRPARRFGRRCMQLPLFGDMVFRARGMGEDCLYLNVWAPVRPPQAAPAAKLPVLVYFYGGGFAAGDGSEPRYDGASLAARGIVTVTVNYRLGVFGFLALPALAAESPALAAGNYGLLDQVAALSWVKDNIGGFGGDAARVTIGGESAGSISVNALAASPLARGLFARAIGESGALLAPIAPKTLAAAERLGADFSASVGAPSLAALRALPAATLLRASGLGATPVMRFAPDVDGFFLREAPAATFERGAQADVPLLVGSNSEEAPYAAILRGKLPTPANYRAAVRGLFGPLAGRALALYPGERRAEVRRSATALASDLFTAHATWVWMDLQRRTGSAPVYFYYFDQSRPAKRRPAPGETATGGAVHSAEIEYALGNLRGNREYAWTAADYRTSAILQGYFAQFIKTGDPNGPKLPDWPAVRDEDGGLLRQKIGATVGTAVDRGAARQDFLSRYFSGRTHTP